MTIYHDKPYCLFGDIVSGVDAGSSDELEVCFPVLSEPVGHILSFPLLFFSVSIQPSRNILQGCSQDSFLGFLKRFGEGLRSELFLSMDDFEQVLDLVEQSLAVGSCFRIRQSGEKTDVPN